MVLKDIYSKGISCLDGLNSNNYVAFARCYNAAGQDNLYGSEILKAIKVYKEVTNGKIYSDAEN